MLVHTKNVHHRRNQHDAAADSEQPDQNSRSHAQRQNQNNRQAIHPENRSKFRPILILSIFILLASLRSRNVLTPSAKTRTIVKPSTLKTALNSARYLFSRY